MWYTTRARSPLYWPYLVVPLGEELEDLLVNLPVVGFSEHEGYFIKTTFNYYLTDNAYGNIYVDLYSRLGLGAGIRHNYKLAELGEGFIYLWGIPTSSEPAYKGAFEHTLAKQSWDFTTKNSVENTWVRKETSSDTTLNFSADGLKGKSVAEVQADPRFLHQRADRSGPGRIQGLDGSPDREPEGELHPEAHQRGGAHHGLSGLRRLLPGQAQGHPSPWSSSLTRICWIRKRRVGGVSSGCRS